MLSMRYKAVFLDLDGTLLDKTSQISTRNQQCLRALHERGIPIVIATGRPIESVRQITKDFPCFGPVITLSGSMIHERLEGPELSRKVIPFETMHSVLESCRRLEGIQNIILDEADGFFALEDSKELKDFIGMYQKSPKLFTYDLLPDSPVLSILVHASEGRRSLYEQLHREFGDLVHFTYFSEYPWIELSAFEANKGTAMLEVCRFLGISLEEAVAIGDGANDLEMITAAGLGIAMDNADEEVKAVADRLAPDHREDGVAIALEALFNL